MKPTLFILAAGMGSRYGGLKQIDGLGPNGETIMDYSVYDAVKAGFGKVVFVIREDFAEDFKRVVLAKYEGKVECQICFQAIDKVPAGYSYNPERQKPWGTNHAVLMGKELIHEPFAVINADDYYGRDSFQVLADFLSHAEKGKYCMVGYRVCNTLSENGSVSRGVCATDENSFLQGVVERTSIMRGEDGKIYFKDENDKNVLLEENAPVSMNMWGFTPEYFDEVEEAFKAFLLARGQELKSEFYIPTLVDEMIHAGKATCQVLDTTSKWFGVTYSEDRPQVVAKFAQLAADGVYPSPLF
ncbi:MAG: nucleotidyltransferase [Paludibacteraceae bacterium]|nr:nucleotidyltransferase [Paludibacteraceae bacterium]